MQHFYSIPNQIPERFWVLKSQIVNGVLTETLFFDEDVLFKDSYTCESPFAISLCDFTGIDPEDAEKHYRECFEIAEIAREERINTPYRDEEYEYDEGEDEDMYEEVYNDEFKFVIVSAPSSDQLKDKEWFSECRPIMDEEGISAYGINAYFVPCNRFKEL